VQIKVFIKTDTTNSLLYIVETGLMFLSDGEDVTTTKYDNPTTYKIYDAE